MKRASRAALIGLSLGFAPGFDCGPSSPPAPVVRADTCLDANVPPPGDGLSAVQVGSGEGASFQPLDSGASLTRVEGPQGGSHVEVTVRLFADAATDWSYELAIEGADGVALAANSAPVTACPGAWVESSHVRVFVHSTPPFEGTLRVDARPTAGPDPEATTEVPVKVP